MINLPRHAPFSDAEREVLSRLASGWSEEQRLWLSGFLAGGLPAVPGGGAAARLATGGKRTLTILYGTESGNAESLAARTAKLAQGRGFKARVCNMAESTPAELVGVEDLLVVVSTWGEGDPPESATDFYKSFMGAELELASVRFSVCALGDTSYEQFCQIGREIDERLEKLGAQRVTPRADCDVDFEESYAVWVENALSALGNGGGAAAGAKAAAAAPAPPPASAAAVEYGKKNPFPARMLEKVLLSAPGSKKETWHFELSLEGSGLTYEPGDSLAVVPRNADEVVEDLLAAGGLRGEEEVETKASGRMSLREALASSYDITALSRKVATAWQKRSAAKELAVLLDDEHKEQFKEWVYGRQIVDLLADFPARGLTGEELIAMLRPLPPRLYSIASSPRAHENEVHLTVAAVRYDAHGRSRKGVASTCLADLVAEGDLVPVFVTTNKRFRLPEKDDVPIIMVGPGTGIAPFRAFVEERAARKARGANWLIFGDQRYSYDFLYQLEWQDHLKSGVLSRLDVAFSRDQPEKVYVQDRIREQASEVWKWLEKGAHFYVCGDATRMAPDVHAALLEVISGQGGKSPQEAETYLDELKKNGRYQRDVY